jgi:hypothetical protein
MFSFILSPLVRWKCPKDKRGKSISSPSELIGLRSIGFQTSPLGAPLE